MAFAIRLFHILRQGSFITLLYKSAVHTIEVFNSLRAEFNKRIAV